MIVLKVLAQWYMLILNMAKFQIMQNTCIKEAISLIWSSTIIIIYQELPGIAH